MATWWTGIVGSILFGLLFYQSQLFADATLQAVFLLSSLWGYDYDGDTRTVDSHIKRLRAKLDAVPHPDWQIKTVWGVGYSFEEVSS